MSSSSNDQPRDTATETSSNTIGSGASLTFPSPSPTPTRLTLSLQPDNGCLNDTPNGVCAAAGTLYSDTNGPGVARATITFTGGGSIANFTN